MADGFAVASHGILGLAGGQLCHLPFIHLLGFFDAQSCVWEAFQSGTHAAASAQRPLYVPVSAKLPHLSDYRTTYFIKGKEPARVYDMPVCNMTTLAQPVDLGMSTQVGTESCAPLWDSVSY